MSKRLIYTAGPYSADDKHGIAKNIDVAHNITQILWDRGFAVICPHKNSAWLENPKGPDDWLGGFTQFLVGDFSMISRCDAMVMLPGWENSKGACAEYIFAKWLELPVFIYPQLPEVKDVRGR